MESRVHKCEKIFKVAAQEFLKAWGRLGGMDN